MKILVPVFFLLFAGCVSLPRSFHAMNYKNQTVYFDRNHYYKVGALSKDWKQSLQKEPGIVFKNSETEATIATEAICGAGFQDAPLRLLTTNLFSGMADVQRMSEEQWMLSGRAALYTKAMATLDGVPVSLNIVVIKKDNCEFDFYAISIPEYDASVKGEFLGFVKGFDY